MEDVESSAEKDGLIFLTQRSKKATGQYKNKTWFLARWKDTWLHGLILVRHF